MAIDQRSPVVVVTGANGLVGMKTCAALVDRGATVRGVVRRAGQTQRWAAVKQSQPRIRRLFPSGRPEHTSLLDTAERLHPKGDMHRSPCDRRAFGLAE